MLRITGDELVAKLGKSGENARKGLQKGIEKACLSIVDEAKRNCTPGQSPYDSMYFPSKTRAGQTGAPFDTGMLRRSITSMVSSDDKTISGAVGTNVEYAVYVHEGTSKMQARPFITDAIRAKRGEIEDIMKKYGGDGLKETETVSESDIGASEDTGE